MEKGIYILTTQDCTKCPNIKKWANEFNIEHIVLDAEDGDQGSLMAGDLGIMAVPTIVDNRTGEPEVHRGEGLSFAFLQQNKNL